MTITAEDYEVVENNDLGITVVFKKAGYTDVLCGVRPIAPEDDLNLVLQEYYPFSHFGLGDALVSTPQPEEEIRSDIQLALFTIKLSKV